MKFSTSSVTWTIIALFIVGGLNGIITVLPPTWAAVVSAVIGAIGLFTHNGQIRAGKVA